MQRFAITLLALAFPACHGGRPDSADDSAVRGGPTASIAMTPDRGWYPLTATLDGSGSAGAEGFVWDLDGDGTTDSDQASVQHVFDEPGSWPVSLTVTDAQGRTDMAEATLEVLADEPEQLFVEHFDRSPFDDGRWSTWLSDCTTTREGTVDYRTDGDGCGGAGGYITRDGTERCLIYEGEVFDTAGYHELVLEHWLSTGGGSVTVEGLVDGGWQVLDTESGGTDSWQQRQVALSGSVTGLRLRLEDDGAIDCLSIAGVPQCRPTQARACQGGTALISVSAVGGEVHQWSMDGVEIEGETEAQLWLEGVTTADQGAYRCTIQRGGETLESNASTLVIEDAPAIDAQPSPAEVTAGQDASFAVEATGAGPLAYHWQRDGQDIAGATDATLLVEAVDASDEGSYTCTVFDDCGSTTSEPASLVARSWDGEVALVAGTSVHIDLDYESPWIVEAELEGCYGSGRFDRYLQQEDRLDLFNRGEDNLAFRLANRQIWFESANVGSVSTEIGETDHFGETLTANVESGDHHLRIEYLPDDERARLYWDNTLIGDWNLLIESVPGPMGQVEASHVEGGTLRWYQGSFTSLADL